MKRRIIACLGMIVCMIQTSCGILPTEEEFNAAPVVKQYEGTSFNKVALVRGDLVVTEEITGRYKGTVKEEILPEQASVIKKIYVKEGEKVRPGDKVIGYSLPGSESELRKAQDEIDSTMLKIRHARKLMEMEIQKQKRIGGSSNEIANVKNQYNQQIKSYESSLKLLRMDAKIAQEEISAEEVTASVRGVVTYVDEKAEGVIGDSEKPVIKIEGAQKNRFEAQSKYASHCKDGELVTIEINAQEYKATVRKDPDSDDTVYFYPNTTLNVEDGTVCIYKVIMKEKKDVLYLPSAIVYETGGKHVVYYEDENGMKSIKEVTVGEKINNFIEITGGLTEGEQVVAN